MRWNVRKWHILSANMNFKAKILLILPLYILKNLRKNFNAIYRQKFNLHFQLFIAKIGEESHEGVQILIQHLAMKAANEKTAFRQNVAGAIIILMLGLPRNYFSTIAKWFFRLGYSDGQGRRMFALEIIGEYFKTVYFF